MFGVVGTNFIIFVIAATGHKLHPGIDKSGMKTLSPNCKVFVQKICTKILFLPTDMCSCLRNLFFVPYVLHTFDFLSKRKNDAKHRLHMVASNGSCRSKVYPIILRMDGVMGRASHFVCGHSFFIPFRTSKTLLNSFFGAFMPNVLATNLTLE